MSRSENVVFLLGAGASVEQGLPVMAKFFSTAKRRLLDDYKTRPVGDPQKADLNELLEFYKRCRNSSHAVNRDWENIEELYTQADLRRIAGIPTDVEAKDLCDSIAWAIWDIYRTDNEDTLLELNYAFNAIIESDLKPAIITTNYDLVAERAISHCETQRSMKDYQFYYPGFGHFDGQCNSQVVAFDGGDYRNFTDSYSITIVKLHGSVNWLRYDDKCHAFYDKGLRPNAQKHDRSKRTLNQKFLMRSEFVDEFKTRFGIEKDT